VAGQHDVAAPGYAGDGGRGVQVGRAQRRLDLDRPLLDVALPSRPAQRGGDLGPGQRPAGLESGCQRQDRHRVQPCNLLTSPPWHDLGIEFQARGASGAHGKRLGDQPVPPDEPIYPH
jgi:hypothetical protein